MRVRVDRGADAMHIELIDTPGAPPIEVAEGLAVSYDAAGRIVGVELRGVDPRAWHEFTVELAGLTDRPAIAAPRPTPLPRPTPAPAPYGGPLTWDPEAEEAMLQMPFFSRGRLRLAASALARKRGQDRVTLDTVKAAGW